MRKSLILQQLINEKKDKQVLQNLYISKGLSIGACAKIFKTGLATIRELLKIHEIPTRSSGPRNLKGPKNPNWKGGPMKCFCLFCGKEFHRQKANIYTSSGIKGKYCSKACTDKSKYWGEGWEKRSRERVKTIPRLQLRHRMATLLRKSLKTGKGGISWEVLVGYSTSQLKQRLMRTMPHGYKWQDFLDGKLHIDHIIPVSVFNFDKPEHLDFQRCWALKNLQLLPARENLIKNDGIEKPFQPSLEVSDGEH